MVVRILVISDVEREACHALALFAARPENHYRPGPGVRPPGLIPEHCIQLGPLRDFRCVFSFTRSGEALFRHLSVSVPSRDLPHVVIVEEIARLFGFKGGLEDWSLDLPLAERCIVLAQRT